MSNFVQLLFGSGYTRLGVRVRELIMGQEDYKVINNKSRRLFYIPLKDKEARLRYKMRDEDTIDLISTYVPEEYRGTSYAKDIVKYALNYARENNYNVIATCPYVQSFLKRNADQYKDLNWVISEEEKQRPE